MKEKKYGLLAFRSDSLAQNHPRSGFCARNVTHIISSEQFVSYNIMLKHNISLKSHHFLILVEETKKFII